MGRSPGKIESFCGEIDPSVIAGKGARKWRAFVIVLVLDFDLDLDLDLRAQRCACRYV